MPEKLARSVVVTPCCRHHSLTERPLLRHSWICAAHSCSSARCFNSALVILTSHNTTVAKPFATFRYYCLMCVYARLGLTVTIIPLVLLLAMLLSLPAYAASPRVMTILPAISFDGTTANCRVSVSADRSTDQISAVIQLWNGSTRIARWTDSGTGYLLFSNSATVSKGKTYELTVDVKINGVSKPQVSIEGTCK